MRIIPANQELSKSLTDLTMRSKAHWGYSEEQMESWREELTISEDYLSKQTAYVLYEGQELLGYYSFEALSGTKIELDNLFVDPNYMGKGFGGLLLSDFIEKAEMLGFKVITLDADPNAQPFYQKHGFQIVGRVESSIPGRYLPVMHYQLSAQNL